MSRSSLGRAALLLALACGAIGCGGECAQSADVQLSLDGTSAAMSQVKKLAIGVTVDGGTRRAYRLDLVAALTPGRSVLLSPATTIDAPAYAITIDVTAMSDDLTPLLFGQLPAQKVGTNACNQLRLTLTTIGGDIDGGVHEDAAVAMPDLAGTDGGTLSPDLSPVDQGGPDLLPCTATTPDEDSDGRGDVCDVCAANADPTITDSDSDGVPDVCDPSPAMAGNKAVYFQPFNATPPGWSGTFTVAGGVLEIAGSAAGFSDSTTAASDPNAGLPVGVLMQTYGTPTAVSSDIDGGMRIFLTNGNKTFICYAEWRSVGGPVLGLRESGAGTTEAALQASGNLMMGQLARYRLWQRGTTIGCEMARGNGTSPVTVTRNLAATPTGPLRPGVGVGFQNYSNAGNVTARYTSVFAASFP